MLRGRGMPGAAGLRPRRPARARQRRRPAPAQRRAARACSSSSTRTPTSETYGGRGVLRQAEERVPLSSRRRSASPRADGERRRAAARALPGRLRGASTARRRRRAGRVHRRCRLAERSCGVSGLSRSSDVAEGWEDALARVPPRRDGRAALGRAALGAARRQRARRRDRPGSRVRHRRAPDDAARLELLLEQPRGEPARRRLRLGRALDRGGEARLRAGARGRRRPERGRGRRARTPRERRRRSTRACSTRWPTTCRPRTSRSRTSRSTSWRRCARRALDCARLVISGYLAAETTRRSPASAHARAARGVDGWAADVSSRRGVSIVARRGELLGRFLGCKVSHADAQALRERLLADGHVERRRRATSPSSTRAVSRTRPSRKSRKAAARAARTHERVYVTGCGANLAADAFAGLPENVVVVARPSEETPAGRRRRRRDRLCPGRRAARPRARVRQGSGRLLLLVRLLRHPARPRRVAQPLGRGGARASRRRVGRAPRGRAYRVNLGCYRDRAAGLDLPRRPRGRRDARARPAPPLLDRDQPRERRADPGAARHAGRPPPPPRPAPVRRRRGAARDGPPLPVSTFLRRLAPLPTST